MGVPGLWDILRPAGQQRALAQLAVHDGFERNPGGRRGLRVGIDASIWFFHAAYGREGENPELRTLFFRCARLMSRPFLPLFVFDGPHRPELKRKKKIGGKDHWMVSGMQEIIEAFGFEWWCAPGEAEAELAYLNRIGVIDAIITDDVDTFLFGATMIIRNPGKMLSGNSAHPVKNTAGRDDGEHTYVYAAADLLNHPEVCLSQDGLILIALLRGGDYDPDGLDRCGTGVAHALARCGFAEKLLSAARNLPRSRLPAFLDGWRNEVRAELRSNARGFLNSKKSQLAKSLPDTFPNLDVLQLYTHPITSERKDKRPELLWEREPDLMKLASLCERKFEWGVREIIIKRFRTVIWAPIVLRIMRRAVLDVDATGPSTPKKKKTTNDERSPPGTPSKMITQRFSSLSVADGDVSQQLIMGIRGKREHASTDGMPEYRLEINPAQLVRLTAAGVQGYRVPPSQYRGDSDDEGDYDVDEEDEEKEDGKRKKDQQLKKAPPDPDSYLRMWMPACIVERVEPAMVAAYEGKVAQKLREKEEKAAKKAEAGASSRMKSKAKESKSAKSRNKAVAKRTGQEEEEEEELSAEEDFSHVFGLSSRGKSKNIDSSRTKRRTQQRPAPTAHEREEEEEEDSLNNCLLPNLSNNAVPFAGATSNGLAQPRQNAAYRAPKANSPKASRNSARPSSNLKSSEGLPKQKTILDLLDERSPHGTSSMKLTSSPRRARPRNVHPILPEPFPMSSAKDNECFWKPKAACIPNRDVLATRKENNAKGEARQSSSIKSESEESLSSPKKSPRKGKKHTSPSSRLKSAREKANTEQSSATQRDMVETITDSEEDVHGADVGDRPTSPSPIRQKVSSTPNAPSKSMLPESPKRVKKTTTSTQASPRAPTRPGISSGAARPLISQQDIKTVEIVEITSGSESEQEKPPKPPRRLAKESSMTVLSTFTQHVSSSETTRRVDTMFPVVKSKLAGHHKATVAKTSISKISSHQSLTYNMADVIEIL